MIGSALLDSGFRENDEEKGKYMVMELMVMCSKILPRASLIHI